MKRGQVDMLWAALVQIVIAAGLILLIYTLSAQHVQGESFELQLHAEERALTAETIGIRNTGVMQLHSFSSIDYTTIFDENSIIVRPPTDLVGKRSQMFLPTGIVVSEQELTGRGIRWSRTGSALTITSLTVNRECPSADFSFDSVAVIGQPPYDAYLEAATANSNLRVESVNRLSDRRNEDFFIRLDDSVSNQTIVYTGVGEQNDRIRCLFANLLDATAVNFVVEAQPVEEVQLNILLANPQDAPIIRDVLIRLLEEIER